MSLLVLDEQLTGADLFERLSKSYSVANILELRPNQRILDDRIPVILLTLDRPTFLTLDHGFCRRKWCHPGYAILYFALPQEERRHLLTMVRSLFRLVQFGTRAARMGKVARVTPTMIEWWQFKRGRRQRMLWSPLA